MDPEEFPAYESMIDEERELNDEWLERKLSASPFVRRVQTNQDGEQVVHGGASQVGVQEGAGAAEVRNEDRKREIRVKKLTE